MSKELRVVIQLNAVKSYLQYISQPQSFTADMSLVGGPTPGMITVTPEGTDVDLSELVQPGMCWITNLDDTNFVEYGIKDPNNGTFYPLGELLPGEFYLLRLSRNLFQDYTNTGTGTGAADNTLHFKANGADCKVRIDTFER